MTYLAVNHLPDIVDGVAIETPAPRGGAVVAGFLRQAVGEDVVQDPPLQLESHFPEHALVRKR